MSEGDSPSADAPKEPGPFDDFTDCSKLEARVVESDNGDARVHGYSVSSDLSQHYSHAELMLLSLTGEPPDEQTGRAFQILAKFVAPVGVAEAPVHAARVAHVISTEPGSLVALASVGLSEQARSFLDEYSELIRWLENDSGDAPDCVVADDRQDADRAGALIDSLAGIGFEVGFADKQPGFWPTALATGWQCGLRTRQQFVAALVSIRLPVAVAEATSTEGGDLTNYPMNLETFEYRHERNEDEQ